MKYNINTSDKKSAYMQLYLQIRHDIISGAYRFGSKLPSKRLLAEEANISVITVEHAYAILCDEGYVESRERSGYFVIYLENNFISAFDNFPEQKPVSVSNIHTAGTSFPFSVIAKTMRKVLLDYSDRILVKSPNYGCFELRGAISSYLSRSSGISVKPEQIIIGSGAEYLYSLISQLLGSKRTFALESPSYDKIRQVYNACRVEIEMLKMGSSGIKTDELMRSKASVLHITPFNSFPSGITATVSKRNEYIRWAESRNGYIIEDNYASEFTLSSKSEDTVFSMSQNDNVIYLNTFSKTIAPSFRIGYMVLPSELLNDFRAKLGFYSCTVPVFEQYVLAELINTGDFERHINRVRRRQRKLKQ